MRAAWIRTVLAALLAAWPALASAGAVELDARPMLELGSCLDHLVDDGGSLSLEEARAALRAGRFQPVGAPGRGLGVGARVAWFHATLRGGQPGRWQLTWDQPLVDRLDAWLGGPGWSQHLLGGLGVPLQERTILHVGPYHQLPLGLAAGEEVDLLLRVASSRPLVVDASIWTATGLEAHAGRLWFFSGLEHGVLLIVVLLGLVSAWARRDRWSVRLAAVLAAYLLYGLSASGLGARWFWPDTPRFTVAASPFFAALAAALGLAYSRAYVDAARHHPRLDRAAAVTGWLVAGCAGAALAAPWLGHGELSLHFGAVPSVVTFLFMATLALAAVRRGHAPARWFLTSCAVVACFGVLYILGIAGLLPGAATSAVASLRPALLAGALLLFVGVALRTEGERRQSTAGLERAVAERTASLRETVARLEVEVLEREAAQRRLRETEERFRVAFQVSPDSINLTRVEDGTYVAVNQGFTQLTGWTEADVLGRSSTELQIWVDPADRARLVAGLRAHGVVQNQESRFRCKDGRVITALMSAQVVKLGGADHLLSIARDISAMRRAEAERDALAEQLRDAQKMEAIGRLAGGVAHDFNNLLTAVTTNASLALMDLPPGDPARPYFEEIEDAAARATTLTRQLLAFSRRQVLAPRPLDLARHVEGMAVMLRRVLGEDVSLTFTDRGATPPVLADPGQVEQVVLNLAVNARDAAGPGGRIVVATLAVEVAPGQAGAERVPGRYGAIEVRDDGPGIDPAVLPHIFEPFYTTKKGKGTGLGLSTVYGIATQHGGFVEVESAPGQGTRIRVCLPEALEPAGPRADAPPAEGVLPHGFETVLLAEDEPAVREATRALLARLGYRVLVAGSGEAALAVARAHPGPIHLLLTDVVMPGLNGRQLAERLLQARPDVAVVYMSGYTQDVVGQAGIIEEGLRLVQKPFSPAGLAEALRHALSAVPSPAVPAR